MVEIPDKVYFKIGEVARLADLKPYVLRYWESEFGVLRPKKSRSGQRLYRRSDVELILHIKTLLKKRKFTIAGARAEMSKGRKSHVADVDDDTATLRQPPEVSLSESASVTQLPADPALEARVRTQDELLIHLRSELEQLRATVRSHGRIS
jgi:DNA-binding transcriptional MerR regulator